MRLEEVFENIRIRDEQNSHRAVYTSLAEMETTSSGKFTHLLPAHLFKYIA